MCCERYVNTSSILVPNGRKLSKCLAEHPEGEQHNLVDRNVRSLRLYQNIWHIFSQMLVAIARLVWVAQSQAHEMVWLVSPKKKLKSRFQSCELKQRHQQLQFFCTIQSFRTFFPYSVANLTHESPVVSWPVIHFTSVGPKHSRNQNHCQQFPCNTGTWDADRICTSLLYFIIFSDPLFTN